MGIAQGQTLRAKNMQDTRSRWGTAVSEHLQGGKRIQDYNTLLQPDMLRELLHTRVAAVFTVTCSVHTRAENAEEKQACVQ